MTRTRSSLIAGLSAATVLLASVATPAHAQVSEARIHELIKEAAERVARGDSQIDPSGELTNLAATVYAQLGDIDTAIELTAKYLAANPNKRAFAANDKSWWTKNLRSDPRYQALVKTSN